MAAYHKRIATVLQGTQPFLGTGFLLSLAQKQTAWARAAQAVDWIGECGLSRRRFLPADDQIAFLENFLALFDAERDAVHRTHLLALRLIVVADAFGAQVRVDDVDIRALRNRAVRALGLAHVAIDAFIGDH